MFFFSEVWVFLWWFGVVLGGLGCFGGDSMDRLFCPET